MPSLNISFFFKNLDFNIAFKTTYILDRFINCAYRHKMFALQQRAIRFVFNLSYRADCKNKFIECRVLTLPSLYIYECLLYAHKEQINCTRNRDIHSYNLRNNNDIRKDRLRLIKRQNSQTVHYIYLFNFQINFLMKCVNYLMRNLGNQFLIT